MINTRLKLPLSAAVGAAILVCGMTTSAPARNDGAAIAAGIIAGAAVGAAIASEHKHSKKIYVPGPAPQPAWSQTYSPQPGILCYPAQRACYKANGGYSGTWTSRIYAR